MKQSVFSYVDTSISIHQHASLSAVITFFCAMELLCETPKSTMFVGRAPQILRGYFYRWLKLDYSFSTTLYAWEKYDSGISIFPVGEFNDKKSVYVIGLLIVYFHLCMSTDGMIVAASI